MKRSTHFRPAARASLGLAAALLLAGCVTRLPPGEATIFDGTYSGIAEPTDPNLPDCGNAVRVDGFVVKNGDVEYGTIRGPISSDASFRADNRGVELAGRFFQGGFEGQLLFRPICARVMRLTRRP